MAVICVECPAAFSCPIEWALEAGWGLTRQSTLNSACEYFGVNFLAPAAKRLPDSPLSKKDHRRSHQHPHHQIQRRRYRAVKIADLNEPGRRKGRSSMDLFVHAQSPAGLISVSNRDIMRKSFLNPRHCNNRPPVSFLKHLRHRTDREGGLEICAGSPRLLRHVARSRGPGTFINKIIKNRA